MPHTIQNCSTETVRFLWIKFLVLTLIFCVLFYDTLDYLLYLWSRPDNSYCYLIPAIAAYLIWENRDKFMKIRANPSWTGMFMLVPGIILFWFGELGGEYFTQFVAGWLIMTGSLWLLLGNEKIRVIWFPLFITATMFPLPSFIQSRKFRVFRQFCLET